MPLNRSGLLSLIPAIEKETGSHALGRFFREWISDSNGSFLQPPAITSSAALTVTPHQHGNKIIVLLGTGSSLVNTLPAATGSLLRFHFIVGAVNTSNHVINAAANSAAFYGSIIQVDKDSTAETGYHAAGTTGADVITLNGTTTGGLVGDWLEFCDIATDKYAVRGMCGVPAGSNIATPFS